MNTASDSVKEIATVRIELRHTDPLIWRQVEVPTSITLKASLAAKETDRPRIAAEFRASSNGLKRLQTPPTRAMLKPKNGRMNTIPTQSMSCRSNTPSAASRTGATPPKHASPTRDNRLPCSHRFRLTRCGLHRGATPNPNGIAFACSNVQRSKRRSCQVLSERSIFCQKAVRSRKMTWSTKHLAAAAPNMNEEYQCLAGLSSAVANRALGQANVVFRQVDFLGLMTGTRSPWRQPFAFQQSSGNGQSAQRPPTKISLAAFFCRR